MNIFHFSCATTCTAFLALFAIPFFLYAQEEYTQADKQCKDWWNDPVVQQIVREDGEAALSPKGCRQSVSTCGADTMAISKDISGTCVREKCKVKVICGKSVETLRKASGQNSILPPSGEKPSQPAPTPLGEAVSPFFPQKVKTTPYTVGADGELIPGDNSSSERPQVGFGHDRFFRALNDFLGNAPETMQPAPEKDIPSFISDSQSFLRDIQQSAQDLRAKNEEVEAFLHSLSYSNTSNTGNTFSQPPPPQPPPQTGWEKLKTFFTNLF